MVTLSPLESPSEIAVTVTVWTSDQLLELKARGPETVTEDMSLLVGVMETALPGPGSLLSLTV